MKILFAIPHYFHQTAGGVHGSLGKRPQQRLQALAACLSAIQQVAGPRQRMLDIARRMAVPAGQLQRHDVDVIVCTTGDRHLLAQLPQAEALCRHHPTRAEPMLLGFECQAVLRDHLGRYDYYCYLEDDLVLEDPWFFAKLAWFNQLARKRFLVQPNRYERASHAAACKLFVDGDLRPDLTARFQDRAALRPIEAEACGLAVRFVPPLNPHSGCYFLTAEQMADWTAQAHFLDRDTSWIGPLESAATLGLLKTFQIYKPALEQAGFLEIRHFGTQFLRLIGTQVREAAG